MNHLDASQEAPAFADCLFPMEPTARPVKAKRPKRQPRPATGAKHFVLDTNVLLHDPFCLGRFKDNHIHIPVDVLGELDKFKNEQSERGANARAVHRALTATFAHDREAVASGAPLPGGGTLRLALPDFTSSSPALARMRATFPDFDRVDHRILACAMMLAEETLAPTILVSKDLNMQLKALAVGLEVQDYLNDKVEARDVESYELRAVDVHPHELQRFASSGSLDLRGPRSSALTLNEYVLLRDANGKTMPGRIHRDGLCHRLATPEALHIPRGIDLRPMNLGQQCFVDALLDPEIALVTCYGQAGTGKTLIAVAAGLHAVFQKQYVGMTVSRPVVAMGDTLGFLPGTLDEKMRPWLQPIYDALEVLMPPPGVPQTSERKKAKKGQPHHPTPAAPDPRPHMGGLVRKPYEYLIEGGLVEIEALCYIRGRSIPRRFFILDEAQQLTPLEAKTVVTRMSRGAKLVLVGDPAQIDNPYVDRLSNGLVYTRNRLKGEPLAAHVCLSKGERSPLAEAGARLM